MIVAESRRRNRKMTSTTSATVTPSVNCTSFTESRIDTERSKRTSSCTDAGICARNEGSSAFTASTTATVFVPGWRWMASVIPRSPLNQLAILSFSTQSIARPTSRTRTGMPFRYVTMSGW